MSVPLLLEHVHGDPCPAVHGPVMSNRQRPGVRPRHGPRHEPPRIRCDDGRTLVKARLERALGKSVRPARYGPHVPLTLSVRHVPAQPLPVDQALQAVHESFGTGTGCGKPWSTSRFRLKGRAPEEWAGHRVEAVIEGLSYDAAGVPSAGGGGGEPDRPARVHAYAAGRRPDRRGSARLPIPGCRPRRTRRRGVTAAPGRGGVTEELGVQREEIRLPDSPGRTAGFPRLVKLAGIRWSPTTPARSTCWNGRSANPP